MIVQVRNKWGVIWRHLSLVTYKTLVHYEHIQKLSEADWLRLLIKLRKNKLIAMVSKHETEVLDAHPLVSEHFGELRNTLIQSKR